MRHFVGLDGLRREALLELIERTCALRDRADAGQQRSSELAGRAVALLFFEPSTRTRFSFEMACHRLGAAPLVFHAATSSAKKGESVADTVRALKAVGADAVVIRHSHSGLPHALAERCGLPVVNAGDGTNEHPTQALLDLATLRARFDDLSSLTVGIVGDLAHSRVARSNCIGLRTLGARVLLSGPAALQDPSLVELGCEQRATVHDLAEDVDALMMLRIQHERLEGTEVPSAEQYRAQWGLTSEVASRLREHALVMHPGPMNRGVEIDDAVADGPQSVIYEQMVNGVFARMAVLLHVMNLENRT